MGNVSRSFYNDWSAAKKAKRQEEKTVSITRLTKSGKPSKIASDTHYFCTNEEAEAYIERMRKLNPTLDLRYTFNK